LFFFGEKRLALVKSQALAQTASIDELFRTIDALKEEMRSKRLTLDKLVKATHTPAAVQKRRALSKRSA
jgi:predicted phage-related endonuclease